MANKAAIYISPVNKEEAECLIRQFNVLLGQPTSPAKAVTGLDRGKFRSILHNMFRITDDIIMDRGMQVEVSLPSEMLFFFMCLHLNV